MLKLKSDASTLVLTNRKKVLWPVEGYTKGDLLERDHTTWGLVGFAVMSP
jgi:hypothetical protein